MNQTFVAYGALVLAIVSETVGTSLLQQSRQFTRPWPTIGMAIFYIGSFYFLSISLRTLPMGVAYALWAGLGMLLVAGVGFWAFQQQLDLPALLGLGFIVVGVFIINVFSKSIPR